MGNKVLVALDGSRLSETVLPWVSAYAGSAGLTEAVLLSIIPDGSPEALDASEQYLRSKAHELERNWRESEGVASIIACVLVRNVEKEAASAIIEFAGDNAIDLIILSTHGQSGLGRRPMGSVVLQVLHGSTVPVFLVPATLEAECPTRLRHPAGRTVASVAAGRPHRGSLPNAVRTGGGQAPADAC